MIFRQLLDPASSTFTYLIGDSNSRDALIIDGVKGNVPHYLQLLQELDLELTVALDTHLHADHISGLWALGQHSGCQTLRSCFSTASSASGIFNINQPIPVGQLRLNPIHTPGHTPDSCCFLLNHGHEKYLFTGDTLLIRGTGRTDLQNGNPRQQYHSLFDKLLSLDDDTWVYPGHDYKGWTRSTIGEERRHNPRLQVSSVDDYVTLMSNLNLSEPHLMDIAIPANLHCGLTHDAGISLNEPPAKGDCP